MPVYSSFNQNISFKHFKNFFKSFKKISSENKEILATILNLNSNQFQINYYQNQRAAFYDYLEFLKSQFPDKDTVMLPAYTCCVVVNAVLKANLKIQFIDTKPNSLNYNPKDLYQALNSKVLAVLIPANFTESIDQDLVNKIKHEYNLILDLANTFPKFNFKDYKAVLLSFGSNKLIDAIYGGAILTDQNQAFLPQITDSQISYELKALVKGFLFISLRKILNFKLSKLIFFSFQKLHLFPLIITTQEKQFDYSNLIYFKASPILAYLLNQSLKDFKSLNHKQKIQMLEAELAKFSLSDSHSQNLSAFYPIQVPNPNSLQLLMQKNAIYLDTAWSFAQIVPKSADFKKINFQPQNYPNSKVLSNQLILIPINKSLDIPQISNIIHIIFQNIHEDTIANYN